MTGQAKQKNSSRSRTAAGTAISSERMRPRARAARPSAAPSSGASSASATGTAMADPWVEHAVEHVGDQVDDDHGGGEHEHDALDRRNVPVVDGLEQLVPDAGQGEDLLHDHRGPDERGQVEPDDREQPDE